MRQRAQPESLGFAWSSQDSCCGCVGQVHLSTGLRIQCLNILCRVNTHTGALCRDVLHAFVLTLVHRIISSSRLLVVAGFKCEAFRIA